MLAVREGRRTCPHQLHCRVSSAPKPWGGATDPAQRVRDGRFVGQDLELFGMEGPTRVLSLTTLAETGGRRTRPSLPAFIMKRSRVFSVYFLVPSLLSASYRRASLPEDSGLLCAVYPVSGPELSLGKELLNV